MAGQQNEKTPEPRPDPAPTLNYVRNSPPAAPSSGRRVWLFISGLFLGICISAAAYCAALPVAGKWGLIMIPIVLTAKIYWAVQLKQSPSWRGFGSGLIASIGLVVLLVGACFGLLASMKF
jgi:hypothetical protein